jgi:hypothetical protein
LLVGVPYHSKYLDRVTDIVEEDLEDEELWEAKDMKIPVYNTQAGTGDGIFVSPTNLGATNFLLRLFIGLRPQISQRLPLMPSTLAQVV